MIGRTRVTPTLTHCGATVSHAEVRDMIPEDL
jgi:hypothetical protein